MASVSIYLFYFFTKETSVVLYSFTLAKEVNIQIFKSSQKFWSFELSSVQVTWMLTYRIFIDSVVSKHSNSSFAPVKHKSHDYLMTKENRKVTSVVNFILVNFCSLPKESLDSALRQWWWSCCYICLAGELDFFFDIHKNAANSNSNWHAL